MDQATTPDPEEQLEHQEWLDSLQAVVDRSGAGAAKRLLNTLDRHARELGLIHEPSKYSPYRNSISLDRQPTFPGDIAMEEKITAIHRWNALAMVMKANGAYGELGGHIASYASAAEIFEVGFNHFFRGGDRADLVYFQPHSAPGVYARAYLEGRLSADQLRRYRQEVGGGGLSSYPHPWLMPDFWQFPTGSMGIGPISAIYNARFMRYLQARGLADTAGRRVWGVFGDGEMDEPESMAALSLAAREKLSNLTFVINCNLQRLDGPVRGNGQIIPELESIFQGAGWNVIKVLWGSEWDALFARDTHHALLHRFSETVDGKYQTLGANDGSYNLKHFFAEDPEVMALVQHMSDDDIDRLKRGGHDFRKLFSAFKAAQEEPDRPTVILAKTKKGFGMGAAGESKMTAHQTKKLNVEGLKALRDRFDIGLTDAEVEAVRFHHPGEKSDEVQYLMARREALGGFLPTRRQKSSTISMPEIPAFARFALEANDKGASTTMALVRMLGGLLKDKELGPKIVPIVADEARTFGMANLFRQIGIYTPGGQRYEPEDSASLLTYREQENGQLLEEGISEAGALASWTAAATSYSNHDLPVQPIYIYYSMFGFQRVGDLIWAAGDQRARGFLIGATAGRTTLSGEGLQHQDGSSQLVATTVPNCRAYDPCFSYELATILHHGATRMLEQQEDEFYYLTVMNENYPQPAQPDGVDEGIVKGMYLLKSVGDPGEQHVQLLGSGTILREVLAAADLLDNEFAVSSDVWSVTSFTELARDGVRIAEQEVTAGEIAGQRSFVATSMAGKNGPAVAATDYVRQYAEQIRGLMDRSYHVLGTDGYGRSDTRIRLRSFFQVDRWAIARTALIALCKESKTSKPALQKQIRKITQLENR